jgi:hypothetical protein
MFIFSRMTLLSLAAVGFAASAQGASAQTDSLTPVTAGRLTVGWTQGSGLTVSVTGFLCAPFRARDRQSRWKGALLNQPSIKPTITDWTTAADGSKTATILLENADALCRYTLTASPQSSVTIDLGYRLKRDIPAEFEYTAGFLSGACFRGRESAIMSQMRKATPSARPRRSRSLLPRPGNTQQQNRLGHR